MPLTLEQYAELLDQRGEPRPAGPVPTPFPKLKPLVKPMPDIRCVVWSGYGTLMLISGGELFLVSPDPIMRKVAFEKTIQEFKMWQSMSRKPGEPWAYMCQIFEEILSAIRMKMSVVKGAEVRIEQVWERVLARLFQKDYYFDTAQYGDKAEFCKKISYYYLLASQGVALWPNALSVLKELAKRKVVQGIYGNGQCNSPIVLSRGLQAQGEFAGLPECFTAEFCLWSFETGFRTESPAAIELLLKALLGKRIDPAEALVVGTDAERDVAPAKRRGIKTALLLADRPSCKVKQAQLDNRATRPDVLLTSFEQILDVVRPG